MENSNRHTCITIVLNKISDFNFGTLKNYMNCIISIDSIENVIVSSTGYTGAGGYEIYCDNKNVKQIWDTLLNEGKEFNILPIGLAARDSLRIEMGYCLYGNDIDEKTSPLEANLKWITKVKTNFIGSNIIEAEIQRGVKKKLVGFKLLDSTKLSCSCLLYTSDAADE